MPTVSVNPELIRWAIDRSGLAEDELRERFGRLDEWRSGKLSPTLKQLESFAKKTMTPFGYLLLEEPPVEDLPIPDFRTVGDVAIRRPSPNLIDTIQTMQRRQQWMREYLIEQGQEELPFVGSVRRARNVIKLATQIRETLGLASGWAEKHKTWEDALRTLRIAADRLGIMIATSGIVGLNTHRPLDPQEFRGFVLCDSYAPLIFVNGADSKSAQMFTLAHELVHVWLGKGGLFNLIRMMPSDDRTERFCNQVAAELLVPAELLTGCWDDVKELENPFQTIARRFKVSPIVAARRALDLGLIDQGQFFEFYKSEMDDWRRNREAKKKRDKEKEKSGGNFYRTQDARLGTRFAYAVVSAAKQGRILYRDAYSLTGLRAATFERYADILTEKIKKDQG